MEKKKYLGIIFNFVKLGGGDAITMSAPGEIGADGKDDYMYDW